MLKSQKNVALVKNSSEAVGAKNLLPVHTEKNVSVEAKNVSPQQNEKSIESRDKACLVRTKEARKRYLERLREAYAEELFSKFLNELSGTLTMKNHKGTWYLVFSCGDENGMVQAKGKTLAHALIDLATKIPLTPEGETRVLCEREGKHSAESKAPLLRRGGGEEFKTVAL